MLTLFIVLLILGIVMVLLPEFATRSERGAKLRESVGDTVLGIIGGIGTLLVLVGILGIVLEWRVPSRDYGRGIEFNDRESLLLFGALQIRYYGIIIVAAMLAGAAISARLARVDRRDPEHIWGALTWAIIPGIILARLWFVTFPPVNSNLTAADYYSNFFNLETGAIAIWSGGLSIFGAVLGGLIGALIYFRRNGLNTPAWLDIAAVGLPLGQAIGRWANYLNQELYGTATTLPWGIPIDGPNRVFPYLSTVDYPVAETLFHPLFLYEALWSLVAFVVLLQLFLRRRHQLIPGDIFLIYLMQYSFIRFLLEFLRLEVSQVGPFNWSQVVTLVIFVGAGIALFLRHQRDSAPTRREAVDRTPPSGAAA